MNTVDFTYGGKTLHLYCNGAALFAMQALDPPETAENEDAPDVLELMMHNDAAGYRMTSKVAQILAEQGELCRRYLKYDAQRIPTAEELLLLLSPVQMVALRVAIYRAVSDGYGAAGGDGDIDTGLAELEKKRP